MTKDEINSLIPKAERKARARVKILGIKSEKRAGKGGGLFNWDFFTQFFHEEMDRLVGRSKVKLEEIGD
jgi:hypothetical protein